MKSDTFIAPNATTHLNTRILKHTLKYTDTHTVHRNIVYIYLCKVKKCKNNPKLKFGECHAVTTPPEVLVAELRRDHRRAFTYKSAAHKCRRRDPSVVTPLHRGLGLLFYKSACR